MWQGIAIGIVVGLLVGLLLGAWGMSAILPRGDDHRMQVKINSYASRVRKLANSLEQAVKQFNQGE